MKIVNTSVTKVTDLVSSIEDTRKQKAELISANISFPSSDEEKIKILELFASHLWLEINGSVRTNSKCIYAFTKKTNWQKNIARVLIWQDSNLGRLEVLGSNKYVGLWYADLNSATWFSVISE